MMLAIDAGLLPVGDDDRLLGTITDRDIAVRAIAEGKGPKTPVSEVMSQDVRYCFEDEDSAHVAQSMGELQVRRLPVLNRDKRLVGILSLADLAKAERGQRVGNALLARSPSRAASTPRVPTSAAAACSIRARPGSCPPHCEPAGFAGGRVLLGGYERRGLQSGRAWICPGF